MLIFCVVYIFCISVLAPARVYLLSLGDRGSFIPQIVVHIVRKVDYSRCQVPLYLWWIKRILKCCIVSKYIITTILYMLFTLRNAVGNCILVAKIVILLTISHLADSNSNVHVGCLYEITFPLLFYIQFRYLIT